MKTLAKLFTVILILAATNYSLLAQSVRQVASDPVEVTVDPVLDQQVQSPQADQPMFNEDGTPVLPGEAAQVPAPEVMHHDDGTPIVSPDRNVVRDADGMPVQFHDDGTPIVDPNPEFIPVQTEAPAPTTHDVPGEERNEDGTIKKQ